MPLFYPVALDVCAAPLHNADPPSVKDHRVLVPNEHWRKESATMSIARLRVPGAFTLAIGVILGWGLAQCNPPVLRASGSDRAGESILLTGPTLIRYDEALRSPISQDAIYYLDYRTGRLLATVPSFLGSTNSKKLLDAFAERDLVADFKLDLERGPKPRFMMATGALGAHSDGWAPLYVFETSTSQVAVYKVQQQQLGTNSRPLFQLVEIRSFARDAERAEQ
jgi:hypothetical protein